MKINKNNLFARYYQWIYGSLPNDVCSFFWGSLFALGLFFLLVPGRLIVSGSYDKSVVQQFFLGFFSWLVYGVCISVGIALVGAFGYEFINLWGYLLLGALIGAAVIATVGFAIAVTVYVSVEKLPETTVVQNTKVFIGAVKRDHCTKINWE